MNNGRNMGRDWMLANYGWRSRYCFNSRKEAFAEIKRRADGKTYRISYSEYTKKNYLLCLLYEESDLFNEGDMDDWDDTDK